MRTERQIIHEIADLEETIQKKRLEMKGVQNAIVELRNELFILRHNKGEQQ